MPEGAASSALEPRPEILHTLGGVALCSGLPINRNEHTALCLHLLFRKSILQADYFMQNRTTSRIEQHTKHIGICKLPFKAKGLYHAWDVRAHQTFDLPIQPFLHGRVYLKMPFVLMHTANPTHGMLAARCGLQDFVHSPRATPQQHALTYRFFYQYRYLTGEDTFLSRVILRMPRNFQSISTVKHFFKNKSASCLHYFSQFTI